jgi:hypothetical protein
MKWLRNLSFPTMLLLSLALAQSTVVAQGTNKPEAGDTLPTRTTTWNPTILYGKISLPKRQLVSPCRSAIEAPLEDL